MTVKLKPLFLVLIALLIMTVAVQADTQGDVYQLSLLHEGNFPTPKTFSRNLLSEGDIIKEALFSKSHSIELETDISARELADLYETVVNSEPELFYVMGSVKITVHNGKYIIYPQYETGFELFAFDSGAAFKKEVNNILSKVTDDMTDAEKALAVHDYMARFYEYDYNFENYNIEDIFTEKTGVCQAYADAYTYIMQKKLGIDCYTLSSHNLNHAWNVIKIDGEWYHVDITWDDPSLNGRDYFGAAMHAYFLISSDTIRDALHAHETYDWEICSYTQWRYDFDAPNRLVEPTSERFDDYIWAQTGYSPFIYYNRAWYYVYFGDLYLYDFSLNTSQKVKSIGDGFTGDVFDIYQDTIIFKEFWGTETTLTPINGNGQRVLSALDGAYSFRTNGDKLEYVVYSENEIPSFYELDLSAMTFTVPAPQISVELTDYATISLSNELDGVKYYYTTDGTKPTRESTSGSQIKVSKNGKNKIKLIAVKDGYNDTPVRNFYIEDGQLVLPEDISGSNKIAELVASPVNQNGNIITALNVSSTTAVNLNIENLSGENRNATIIVAFYKPNGRLICAGKKDVLLSDTVTPVQIPVNGYLSNATEIKVFMWAKSPALKPLSQPEAFSVR